MAMVYTENLLRYNPYGKRLEYIELSKDEKSSLEEKITIVENNIESNKQDITGTITATSANTTAIADNTTAITDNTTAIDNNAIAIDDKIDIGGAADDVNTHPTLIDSNKITP